MAAADLLQDPYDLPPSAALKSSQEAPKILASSPFSSLPYPLSLLGASETEETWTTYENLLYSCLRTGDDVSARKCLDRLTERFGATNERIMALTGVFKEATAKDTNGLEKVLTRYGEVIAEDPTNMPVRKRKVATLKALNRPAEAIASLVELLDVSPTDAEAWAELSELYFAQNMYNQAIYALEEVLLIFPNAWPIQARLGELLYILHNGNSEIAPLSESLRRFCRSIELCDDYLRGYYGLKLTCTKFLTIDRKSLTKNTTNDDLPPPSIEKVQKLNELATKKLGEIIRRAKSGEKGWEGYADSELIAARALLDKDTANPVR